MVCFYDTKQVIVCRSTVCVGGRNLFGVLLSFIKNDFTLPQKNVFLTRHLAFLLALFFSLHSHMFLTKAINGSFIWSYFASQYYMSWISSHIIFVLFLSSIIFLRHQRRVSCEFSILPRVKYLQSWKKNKVKQFLMWLIKSWLTRLSFSFFKAHTLNIKKNILFPSLSTTTMPALIRMEL